MLLTRHRSSNARIISTGSISPHTPSIHVSTRTMTLAKALTTVIGCGLGGTAAGGALGFAIGRFAPDAYVAMFRLEERKVVISPPEIGLGLGLAQGLLLGVILGAVLVALVTWHDVQVSRQSPRNRASS
jgi:hypothetical protein